MKTEIEIMDHVRGLLTEAGVYPDFQEKALTKMLDPINYDNTLKVQFEKDWAVFRYYDMTQIIFQKKLDQEFLIEYVILREVISTFYPYVSAKEHSVNGCVDHDWVKQQVSDAFEKIEGIYAYLYRGNHTIETLPDLQAVPQKAADKSVSDTLDTVYRLEGPGAEMVLADIFFVLGIVCFFATVPIAIYLIDKNPKSSAALIVLGLTAVAWVLLLGFWVLYITFQKIYTDARFRVLIKDTKGEWSTLVLTPCYENPSSAGTGLITGIHNVRVSARNEEVTNRYLDYYYSETFLQHLERLEKSGEDQIRYFHQYEKLPNLTLVKKGLFTDVFTYGPEEKRRKIKIHKEYQVEL